MPWFDISIFSTYLLSYTMRTNYNQASEFRVIGPSKASKFRFVKKECNSLSFKKKWVKNMWKELSPSLVSINRITGPASCWLSGVEEDDNSYRRVPEGRTTSLFILCSWSCCRSGDAQGQLMAKGLSEKGWGAEPRATPSSLSHRQEDCCGWFMSY